MTTACHHGWVARRSVPSSDASARSGPATWRVATTRLRDTALATGGRALETLTALPPKLARPVPAVPPDILAPAAPNAKAVKAALNTFSPGCSGGPSGLTPDHLRSLANLDDALTALVKVVMSGDVPADIQPFFFSARLAALQTHNFPLFAIFAF
jgi:hypothetical protein